MRADREPPRDATRRPTVRAKAVTGPQRNDGPLVAAFFGTIGLMLLVNALLNAFPG